jgi:hypothetical protein
MGFLKSGLAAVAAFGFAALSSTAIADPIAAQGGSGSAAPVGVVSSTLPPPSGPGAMPIDKRIEIGGVGAVCTGIGLDAQNNPAWAAYPLKVMATGKAGMYLAKAQITLTQKERVLAEVKCAGPWVFFDVPQGDYKLSAVLEGEIASTNVRVRAPGQAQAVLRFPNQGGEVVPPALQNNDPRALPPTYDPGTRPSAAPATTTPSAGY